MTDNMGIHQVKVCFFNFAEQTMSNNLFKFRYVQFLYAMRIWRHIKILKRSGRGHDLDGVSATKPGECAVECPACPHPGRNLPSDWENAPIYRR